MLSEISLAISISIGEALCINILNSSKRRRIKKRLDDIAIVSIDKFANSSIDTYEFQAMVSSIHFKEMLRNYYVAINDLQGSKEYDGMFVSFMQERCPKARKGDIESFLVALHTIFNNELTKLLENNIELNIMFHLLMTSHREIMQKISENELNLIKFIESIDKRNIIISDRTIKSYHDVCQKEFSTIKFTGIAGVESKKNQNIEDFYVENSFSYLGKHLEFFGRGEIKGIDDLPLKSFFDYGHKIVLLGAAGLGKSTTLNYLFCNYEKIFNANAIKIKIDLKEYANSIGEKKLDVFGCLCHEFSRRVPRSKLNICDIEKIIAEYLENGECLIILDALDEIPVQSLRNKVRDEIDNFCQVYYLNRYIISSREAGYLRNRFDDNFLHIRINVFSDKQIKQYSRNWFKANYASGKFEDFWRKFNEEIEKSKCRELIRNPIVLILALVVFDIEKNLPNRRVEFYKKCIETFLFVREDRKTAFEMTDNLRAILGDDAVVPQIAYYKFDHLNQDAEYKFTAKEFENAIMEAIQVNDPLNWIVPVTQFAKYLIDRTELICEIDEDIYDFAHKTFYEYFLSVYFSKTYTTEALIDLLNDWIGDSNLDEMARLIIEVVIEKNDANQHRQLIEYLFGVIEEKCERSLEEAKLYERNNIIDIFHIVIDLYANGMLQPKFYNLYYDCLLKHSELVQRASYFIRRRTGTQPFYIEYDKTVKYDSSVLAEYFKSCIDKDWDNFYRIIKSLFFLNDDFCMAAIKNEDEVYSKIFYLFNHIKHERSHKENPNGEDKNIEEQKALIDYFTNKQLQIVCSVSEIFLCIVNMCVKLNSVSTLEKIDNVTFLPNSQFTYFITAEMLNQLMHDCFNSSLNFMIFLICLIKCGRFKVNFLLSYSYRNRRIHRIMISEKPTKEYGFLKKINENRLKFIEFLEDSFQNFIMHIKSQKVYDERYYAIYKECYRDYWTYDHNLNARYIKDIYDIGKDEEVLKIIDVNEI